MMNSHVLQDIDRGAAALDAMHERAGSAGRVTHARQDILPPATTNPVNSSNTETWPEPLEAEAFHGLAGEIVSLIRPSTEADDAAVLVQVLAAFGSLVGRGPHVRVEADEHHMNINPLLVGETSKARKGTSYGRVRAIFSRCTDPLWPDVKEGLSSGEGLKWAVRDDPSVTDKRLLVVEPEFAQVLRQASPHGNTLSATIRCAWDTGRLSTLTKNDPVTVNDAHISIIGHITAEELRRDLTATDSANGFANRFLFMCVRRSKCLPFGGEEFSQEQANALAGRIQQAALKARKRGQVSMTEVAKKVWTVVYEKLSAGRAGLRGVVTARAEAQCLRLALIYAMMDEAEAIHLDHLLAAIAVWERCDASAGWIFGTASGNRVADTIEVALGAAGMTGLTRTEIRDLLDRHAKGPEIEAALKSLQDRKMALVEYVARPGGGRGTEVWRAVRHATSATSATAGANVANVAEVADHAGA